MTILLLWPLASCRGEIGAPASMIGDGGAHEPDDTYGDRVPVSGLRRLTSDEYDNTIADLLGDPTRGSARLLPEDLRNPFDNDTSHQEPSQALVEAADALAGDAVARLLADPERRDLVVACTPAGPSDAECLRSFVTRFGRRALRRPLEADEITALVGPQRLAIEEGDFWVAVEIVVRALLQHPAFLYRVEIGAPVDGRPGVQRLTAFELASRLSYFLWGTCPDDSLLDRAAAGGLETDDDVREVAREMLDNPRAFLRLDRFHAMWLGYERLPFDAQLAGAMRAETGALLRRVAFEEDRPWLDLLRADETYVSEALAEHYGLESPGPGATDWVGYGDSGRQGILSHGTFLANGAKFGDTSPVQRGLIVRRRLLCDDIPPPPPGVNVDEPLPEVDPESGATLCKEERFSMHRQGGCAGCHDRMDPIGFGLEAFDQEGRFRTHEPGRLECAIGGQGDLGELGPFVGPVGLAERLEESGRIGECLTRQLYRFALGRTDLDEGDSLFVEDIAGRAAVGEFTLEGVLVELVASEPFRYRREEE